MIQAVNAIKPLSKVDTIQLTGIDRIRQRITEINERFGINGEDFQTTLEREMNRAEQADKTHSSRKASKAAHKSADVDDVDTLKVAGANETKTLNEAAAVEESAEVETFGKDEANIIDLSKLPGEETLNVDFAINPFAVAAQIEQHAALADESNDNPQTTEEMLEAAAAKYAIDPGLVKAIATAESNWNQNAISPVGAVGVMQLMPETAAALGVNPYNERENIEGGAKYIRQMLDTFDGNVRNAVAAYNAGPGAVQRYGGVPPYSETQNYVGRVLDLYK